MRLTFTDIQNQFLRNIGRAGSTDTTILADLALNLSQRYQLCFAKMLDYKAQTAYSFTTVAQQQYYPYPPGMTMPVNVVITIGSVNYPLEPLYNQSVWDVFNSLTFQPSAIPQYFFPRRDDFGIWPIPQDAYTGVLNNFLRDRSLGIADYTTGTVTVTSGSATVTGSGTTWIAAMANRWFVVTDPTEPGQGYWYRISSRSSNTSITLSRTYTGTTGATLTYRIGETPELPEEGHIALVDGVTADYYAGLRSDVQKATWFNNKFWTGDGNNASRSEGDETIAGGLLGLMNRYGNRDDRHVIQRQPHELSPYYKIWATTLSSGS